jgi:hypothetical protein
MLIRSTIFALLSATVSAAPPGTPVSKKNIQPFLDNYCIKCHGPKKQKGQVRFDEAIWEITDNNSAQRWQDILDQLNGGEMPPEDEKQPTTAELSKVLDSLTGSVLQARKRLTDHGGEIKMRRLNRREYSKTIEDLFGFEVSLHDIPEDGEIATFDTVGAEQYFTSAHFEKYLELGRKVAAEAFSYNTQPRKPVTKRRIEPEKSTTRKMREHLADLDRKKALIDAGKSWKEAGFKDEGEKEIILRQWEPRAELRRSYLNYPKVDQGVYNCDVAKWVSINGHVDIRGEYRIHLHGGIVGNPHPLRKIVRLYDRNEIHGTVQIRGTVDQPQTVTQSIRRQMGEGFLSVLIRENQPENTINTMRGYLSKVGQPGKVAEPRAAVWIDWLEIEGPFYPKARPKFENLLYPGKPTGQGSPYFNVDARAREFIGRFTNLAFRRKNAEPAYVDALHQTFLDLRASGQSYRQAMTEVIGIVLASPSFLFIQEAAPEQNLPHGLLDSRELAIRLSYYLWSCPPDGQLYEADLTNPKIYRQQVERLLADPRSQGFRDGFISQWMELDRYDAITVDRQKHYQFNEGVQRDAKQEVREFFGTIIKENLPVSHLIDSPFVVVNEALATHYDLPTQNLKPGAFQKVTLPPSSHRGGLLTQAAFLTTGSNGERSSPVIRGALVMEKILHDKPAPPPPNVPELDAASDKPMTNRQLVLLHQERATCASCHRKMDVIGFGLENFNTIGRWRVEEHVGKKKTLIEPGGVLPDGDRFQNVSELKKLLMDQQDALAEELTESILAYALGRTVEFSDADNVAAILNQIKGNRYRLQDLIREIALSPLFRKK